MLVSNIQHARAIELHIFTDASESAFAAVGYFRILYLNAVDIAFAFGNTRCAPKKILSIPRLELQAAVLGCRIQTSIRDGHNFQISRVTYWSDSKTTLWWIRSPHRRFKPFVAHRVAEILDTSNSTDWNWVPTELNVADAATRAISPPTFEQNSRWLTGPKFLRHPEDQWPKDLTVVVPDKLDEELRAKVLHINQASNFIIKFTNFSSLTRLKRSTAWIMRYFNSLLRQARENIAARKPQEQATDFSPAKCNSTQQHCKLHQRKVLTAAEIRSAEIFLGRQAQTQAFREERIALKMGNSVSRKSLIYQLTPQLDQEDLLRVSGRIDFANCLSADCLNVQRETAKDVKLLKLNLPPHRLTPYVRLFTYTGLDYFGPLQVSVGRRREKRWVALFTCLTIRAIHLEIAADLSTDACILCLRNFINRRGVPVRIRSDNGTNFIGAKKQLGREPELFDTDRIQNELATKGIEWKFSCSLNPSEGGIWERMAQSVKKVLMVTLREEAPHLETLRSLLIKAQNIVNSRPLTELPLTSEEDEPLTPNHFLIGSVNSTQTPNLEDTPIAVKKQILEAMDT
ncbi:uncharacterized protein LOC129953999 [Eupeodes corollae]|uniref:uncharacterized protein LOC129953999 n=1 Tax=Eupeodes corollae TaxID=290404 RepID=UPI0024916093|nr:uncharacterized protein LOC129953999 [Eupeodes corollae]